MTHLPSRARRVFYGWWLVAVSGFILAIVVSPIFQGMSIWAVALERHFGWRRTQLGLALAFTRAESAIMGPVEGYLTDRLGARRMVLMGLLIVSGGFFLFGQVHNLWMFYVAYIIMYMGNGLGSFIPLMTLLNHWFARHRALAMGLAGNGVHLGALLIVPAIAWAIDPDQGRLGWQRTALILGSFVLLVSLPISLLIRNRPGEYGQWPDGEPPATSKVMDTPEEISSAQREYSGPAGADLTIAQALYTPAFWFISLGHGLSAMVVVAIFGHLGLMMQDKEISVQTTGWIISVISAAAIIFGIVGGYVGDRIPKNVALFIFTSIQAVALVILATSSRLILMFLFAVLIGIGFGGRSPLASAIRGEYFGRASYGKILGLSMVPMNALMLLSSPFAGFMRDRQGDYTMAFLILAALCFLGSILFLMAKKPAPRRSSISPEGRPDSLAPR